MLALARWLMQGTAYAAGGAFAAGLIPWLFWFSAAVAALVTLRRGFIPALPVTVAAALPAGWWWTQGDVIPLASVLLVTLMAVILRERMRWSEALITGVLACSVMVQLGIFAPPGGTAQVLEQVRQNSAEFDRLLNDLVNQGLDPERIATLLVGGVTGLVVSLAAIVSLLLARNWQAGLYNPGGFRQEFHALKLAPRELFLLMALGVAGQLVGIHAVGMLAWLPLLIAGIALIHGIIGLKGLSGLWLIGFYGLLIMAWPTIVIVLLLGVIDTFAKIRERLPRSH